MKRWIFTRGGRESIAYAENRDDALAKFRTITSEPIGEREVRELGPDSGQRAVVDERKAPGA